jgi:KamA family protein
VLEQALARLAADPALDEVILSGGDPLMIDDQALGRLARSLEAIPQITRLRVHTRLPVAVPSRVDEELLAWLCGTRLAPVVVIHCNHPNELDGQVCQALGRLVAARVTVLNQSVLLAGVNDSVETLAALGEALLECGVMPYYLHLLDQVRGAARFEVSDAVALELQHDLRQRLAGYLVPRMVRELPGAAYKQPLEGCGIRPAEARSGEGLAAGRRGRRGEARR